MPVFVRRRRAERELRQAEQRKRELLRHNAALRAELAEAQATLPVVRAQVVELRRKRDAQEAVGCAGTDDGLRALSATTEQMADGARDRLEAVTLGEASSWRAELGSRRPDWREGRARNPLSWAR